MYTSGTSGRPKGVMLTNQNAVSTLRNCIGSFQSTENCALLSYLPLAHIFETMIEFLCILTGGHVGYFSGDIKLIASDLVELRPHYFVGVPRVFDKMYSRVMASVADASFVKRWLFHFALKRGIDQTHCAASLTRPKSLDALVWSKLRQKLGFDRVKHLVTGGAPCPTHLIEFLRVMTAGEVLQGYGLTETFAVVSLTNGDDPNLGQMGLPLNCEIKLESVADTDYDPNGAEARGELTLRGECLFKGYFRDEARTREAVRDGWFYTGDVCRLNPNNTISVIDRIKAIFKLSQGEYVSPEVVEIAYGRSGAVNQIYIYGDSTKPFLVAVIVPDVNWALELLSDIQETKTAKSQLSSNSITEFVETFEKLCSENDLKLNSEMQKTLTNFEENLSGFEKIRKVHLEYKIDNQFNGFSPENGLLTPSFKLRRTFLSKRYKKILDSLYEKMGI
ncbi:medium-chain fatty acid-CoA ligase faa2 [Bonamia ostreae]|uniref:Medium-chain fatty acid-CoA ligase faa2 n=1 Tax=Bonamia ostreae TaxID=126728 RepID=A0ABV2ALL9_9EUKA